MNGATWARGFTGTWHAFGRAAAPDCRGGYSVCGLVRRSPDAPSQASQPARACKLCMARLERCRVDLVQPPPCDCRPCFDVVYGVHQRGRGAQDYARDVLGQLPACRCVREWAGATEHVAEPFARWSGLLLAWEMSGDDATMRDVEEAERELQRAWHQAAARYELLDGSHPHGEAKR